MTPDHDETRVRVDAITTEAHDIISLSLIPDQATPLAPWEPGAHIDLLFGPGFVRQYSLCGELGDRTRWRIAILREADGRGGSAYIHKNLAVGDTLLTRGPRNNFPLVDAAAHRFIAGGVGITPILPMVRTLTARGAPWRLLYGGRRRDSMAFVDELAELGGDAAFRSEDEHGLLDIAGYLSDAIPGTAVYCCGPEGLIQATESHCASQPDTSLHVERFQPRQGALEGEHSAFEVVLERAGVILAVGPEQSIVDALEAIGIDVATSCREGTCGTCETAVLEGIPDHRDSVLSASEKARNDTMMICCSRAKTRRLVLDL